MNELGSGSETRDPGGGTRTVPWRETGSERETGRYTDAAQGNRSGSYTDADIEAMLAAEERQPGYRTRQEAAADTWGDAATGQDDGDTGTDAGDSQPGEQRRPDDSQGKGRPGHSDIHDRYPTDYKSAPDAPAPQVDGPHEPAEKWADAINPDKQEPGRRVNCGDCSRSVDSTWHGFPAVAAAVDYPRFLGEDPARMTEWAGTKPRAASMADIGKQLGDLGPGSSAIVGCDWKTGRGHWFNAVNDGGTVKAVDGQSGKVEAWPPTRAGLGYDESRMRYSDAIFFTPDGKVVRHDHP